MKREKTRREFFTTFARLGVLGGLGALVGRLVRRSPPEDGTRRAFDTCSACFVLKRCNFPEAATTRRKLTVEQTTDLPRDKGVPSDARGLCGARPDDAPGSRWIRRELT